MSDILLNDALDHSFKDVKNFLSNNKNYCLIDLSGNNIDKRIYGNFILYYSPDCYTCSAKLVCDTYDNTGNFFIETKDENNCNGWFLECKSDLLLYYFINTKILYIINRKTLLEWFNSNENSFRYVNSINNTYGALVSRDLVESKIDILKFNL